MEKNELLTPAAKSGFFIVGIGASAGGLEALEQFFTHMPVDTGIAFVVVQHLDPTYKGMLPELLQRVTTMPVVQITDRMQVVRDHIYVIPPNTELSILQGVLHLLEPISPRGLRLPIDYFLRSLAADQREQCIGVILSGMGSDGTLGLRDIKENAGAVFVQTPESAKFDGMPRSAIDTGLADVVAPAVELPLKITAYLNSVPRFVPKPGQDLLDTDHGALEKIIVLLRSKTGHDFSRYKKSTIYRRIERRMGLHQLPKILDYVRYLRGNTQEAELLFKELLIGVTSFFRDPPLWDQLKNQVIPSILAQHPQGVHLRAWVPACSTGEEAYSLAMVFKEALAQAQPPGHFTLQVFATDLDRDAVEGARAATYPLNIAIDVEPERLQRFFVQEKHGYRVCPEIREMVIFAPQNLVMDPPFTKLDLLTCRNLLIYLEADLQKKLMPLFHYSLNPGGVLVLGNSETVGAATDLFAALDAKTRIYRRQDAMPRTDVLRFPSVYSRHEVGAAPVSLADSPVLSSETSLKMQTDALLLQYYSPAAVLTTDKGDIVYINGKIGRYLEPAAGKASLNIFAMARDGLSGAMHEVFAKAVRKKAMVALKDVKVIDANDALCVDISVRPLREPAVLQGMVLVVFTPSLLTRIAPALDANAQTAVHGQRVGALSDELQYAREELQSTREEMQTSQEELKSTNEELQSTNEELQSTNEELTTSKEEMQSMNEELQTVNHELQSKVNELSLASSDMKNLLNSTDIATLFLDNLLKVRRYTTQASRIIKLIPSDVGRPITDLASDLDYPALVDDAREVLRSLISHERQVPAKGGRWYTVRIMPYRTQDNRIDGLVVTFVDIGVSKSLELALREALAVLQERFNVQSDELNAAHSQEQVADKAQSVFEKRLLDQGSELLRAQVSLLKDATK